MENNQNTEESRRESLSDTLGITSLSLVLGIATDYYTGLRGFGIVGSRSYGTAVNLATSARYGKWRDYLYKKVRTTDKSSRFRKYLTELLPFNTFQVPLYATVVAAGNLVSNLLQGEVKIDLHKVVRGTRTLAMLSPIIGPITGLYMEGIRRLFKVDSAPKRARKSLERELEVEE